MVDVESCNLVISKIHPGHEEERDALLESNPHPVCRDDLEAMLAPNSIDSRHTRSCSSLYSVSRS